MKKQKKLVVGNWKMNPQSIEEAKTIIGDVRKASKKLKNSQVVECPPFVYLPLFSNIKSPNLFLGAQNANQEMLGSYTGEVSFSQLYQFGVRFVIIGHSERRKMGESDELINKKVKSVVNGGMTVIVCVGESSRDHNGDYFDFIKNQITFALRDVSKKSAGHIVIAYEPIWAIGAKEAMQPSDLHEMAIFIRKVLKDLYGPFSDDVRVLYGGDVDVFNSERLVRDGNVSGLLIGRESLKSKDFVEIMKTVDNI